MNLCLFFKIRHLSIAHDFCRSPDDFVTAQATEQPKTEAPVLRPGSLLRRPDAGGQEVALAELSRHDHRGNRLLAALPPDALPSLDRDLRHVSIARGAVIFEPGAPLDTIYFPQTGLVSLLVVSLTGRFRRDGNDRV